MTITKDTDLSEILVSSQVIDEISAMSTTIKEKSINRSSLIYTLTTSGNGLSETQLLNNEPTYYTTAKSIASSYTSVYDTLESLETRMCCAAIEKERDELLELRECLVVDNEAIDERIGILEGEYKLKINGLLDTNGSTPTMTSTTVSYYDTSSKTKIYNEYYGTSGYITIEEAKKINNNTKIEDIDNRLLGLSETYQDYSDINLVTTTEKYDEAGHKLNTDTESYYKTSHSTGDEVSINGQKYTVDGYYKDADGKDIGIYSDDNGSYCMDSSGNLVLLTDENSYVNSSGEYVVYMDDSEYKFSDMKTSGVESRGKIDEIVPTYTSASDNNTSSTSDVLLTTTPLTATSLLNNSDNTNKLSNNTSSLNNNNTTREFYKKVDGTIVYKDEDGNLKEFPTLTTDTTTTTSDDIMSTDTSTYKSSLETNTLMNVGQYPIYGYVTDSNGNKTDVFCENNPFNGTTSYYIKDPFGNYMELKSTADGSPKTPTYNIIGNEYTLDDITQY